MPYSISPFDSLAKSPGDHTLASMWMGDYTSLSTLAWPRVWHLGIPHFFEEEWESYQLYQAGITQ